MTDNQQVMGESMCDAINDAIDDTLDALAADGDTNVRVVIDPLLSVLASFISMLPPTERKVLADYSHAALDTALSALSLATDKCKGSA